MHTEYDYSDMTSFAIHGNNAANDQHAHLVPIFATSTYTFDNAQQGSDIFSGKTPGYVYSRFANPTVAAAEKMIAGLEAFHLTNNDGTPLRLKALLHASGSGALTTLLLSNLSAGDAVLSHPSLYGGSHELIYGLLPRLGIHALIADFSDTNQLEEIIRSTPALKIIHIETPANPTMNCIDLERTSILAKQYGVKVAVDNTFATPYLQQPFKYGVDFVFHSATKFLNGHGSSICGVLVGKDDQFMATNVYTTFKLLGANANPFDAFLLLQGVKTLALRMDQHCTNAEKIADFLVAHSAVEKVHYNGLATHPGYSITEKQMKRPGSVLSFELKGGMAAGRRFIDRLRMCTRAVSVGTIDTLVSHPASMSHSGMTPEDRQKAGIGEGLIRISVGLESVDDILNDIEEALR